MRNQPVAEEATHDHFHMTAHWTIPNVAMDTAPVLTITTQRCCNRRLVATGPLLAIADLDMPMPMPGMELGSIAPVLLAAGAVLLKDRPDTIVYGTKGRRLAENLMPQPVPLPEPLW